MVQPSKLETIIIKHPIEAVNRYNVKMTAVIKIATVMCGTIKIMYKVTGWYIITRTDIRL